MSKMTIQATKDRASAQPLFHPRSWNTTLLLSICRRYFRSKEKKKATASGNGRKRKLARKVPAAAKGDFSAMTVKDFGGWLDEGRAFAAIVGRDRPVSLLS